MNTPTKTVGQKHEELVAAIVKAVPEIREHPSYSGEYDECTRCKILEECWDKYPCDRPITLEDVLMAFLEKSGEGQFSFVDAPEIHDTLRLWRFGHSLEWHRDNAPETITFLHSLLV